MSNKDTENLPNQGIQRVVRHNDLIVAKMDISLMGMRLFLKSITQIDKDDTDFKVYTISVADILQDLEQKSKGVYQKLKDQMKELNKIELELPQAGSKNFLYTHLFSSIRYLHGDGKIEVRFDPNLKPYLLQLKGNFTMYQLSHVIKMKSAYSIRIYELLKQYQTFGKRTFQVDELRHILGLEDKYPNFNGFKTRILDQAQKDCEQFADLSFTYHLHKLGRKVVAVECFIKNKTLVASHDESVLDLPKNANLTEDWMQAGLSKTRIHQIVEKYPEDYLIFVWKMVEKQQPKKLDSFFLKALQDGYYSKQFEIAKAQQQQQQTQQKQKQQTQHQRQRQRAIEEAFYEQYIEARDAQQNPTFEDRVAFEKLMEEKIKQTPAFQISYETYLKTGTNIEFRDFLLKKYGQPHQYDINKYIEKINKGKS